MAKWINMCLKGSKRLLEMSKILENCHNFWKNSPFLRWKRLLIFSQLLTSGATADELLLLHQTPHHHSNKCAGGCCLPSATTAHPHSNGHCNHRSPSSLSVKTTSTIASSTADSLMGSSMDVRKLMAIVGAFYWLLMTAVVVPTACLSTLFFFIYPFMLFR